MLISARTGPEMVEVALGLAGSESQYNAKRQSTFASLVMSATSATTSSKATQGCFQGAKLPV